MWRSLGRTVLSLLTLVALFGGVVDRAVAADPPVDEPIAEAEIVEYPDFALPITVEVIGDTVAADGRWTQTVKLTVTAGGTFGDASLAAYGNINHYDEMFEAARRLDPTLAGPTLVSIGQEIVLEIDPTRVFVMKQVRRDANGLTRLFASGVRDTEFERSTTSVARLVEFPRSPVQTPFHYPTDGTRIEVPSGGRIVDLRYRAGDDFAAVVRAALGEPSYLAAEEIARQTGWRPTAWPPPTGETKRVVLGPPESYRPAAATALAPVSADPAAQAATEKLNADRARVGIASLGSLVDGTVFRVAVDDSQATARDVSRLLYGDEREALSLAARAGFAVPASPPPDYDPILFGTAAEVSVPFAREWFPYAHDTDPATGAELIRLLNGTVIGRYPAADSRDQGLWESTRFPNGYRSFTYRPHSALAALATAVAYVRGVHDLGSEDAEQEAARSRYAGEFIWDWALGLPREPGDIPDLLELRPAGDDSVLVAVIGPSAALTPFESFVDRAWSRSPLAKAGALLGVGVAFVVGVGLLGRRRG